jgi:hypothetical protein
VPNEFPGWDLSRLQPLDLSLEHASAQFHQIGLGIPLRWFVDFGSIPQLEPVSHWSVVHVSKFSSIRDILGTHGYIVWPRILANSLILAVPMLIVLRIFPIVRFFG